MKKEITKELEELSIQCFGKKYYWKKLTSKGVTFKDPEGGPIPRRIPLSPEGAKAYMEQTLASRAQILKEMKEKEEAKNESN